MGKIKTAYRLMKNRNFFRTVRYKMEEKFLITSPNARKIEWQYKTYNKLYKKYEKLINDFSVDDVQKSSDFVWICWLQGLDNAPELVRACVNSVKQNMPDKNVVIITNDNLNEYINLPSYIIEKHNSGIIPHAQFSDIIRIELLCRYGGLWVDSTVLCTSSQIPRYIFEEPLFVYKSFDLLKTNLIPTVASNWLIASKTNNPILLLTRKLLFQYWKDNNYLIDYYIFHIFFNMATKKYANEWENVPAFNNHSPHTLMFELGKKYSKERFEQIEKMSVFHKLERHTNYSDKKGSMYEYIIKTYGK